VDALRGDLRSAARREECVSKLRATVRFRDDPFLPGRPQGWQVLGSIRRDASPIRKWK
jgi:hypothetical protein